MMLNPEIATKTAYIYDDIAAVFTFGEVDYDYGCRYFGARYYDPNISIWLSVDPLSDKYPNLSGYTYCANNPILFIDPDGRKIVVFYKNEKGRTKRIVLKSRADLSKLNGVNNSFAKSMAATFEYLGNNETVNSALNHRRRIKVKEGSTTHTNYKNRVTVEYNPKMGLEVVDDENARKPENEREGTGEFISPALGFLHELGHALDVFKVGKKEHQRVSNLPDDQYHNPEERRVIEGIEVPAARELGEPVRTNHSGIRRKVAGPTSRVPVEKRTRSKSVIDL